jgi:polar amino acid transport system substrate-binding protein
VDVAAALADELGLRVRFVAVDNTDAAVASQVDVVLSATTDNVESAAIVGSYAESGLAFFHKGEQTVVDVSALQGATVGVQPGSASAAALSHTALAMVETSYPTLNDAFEALAAGEVSYVLCDAYAGAYLATTYADITPAGCIDTPLARGVAVDPSNTSLQQAVQQGMDAISSNGILNYIRARWVGAMPRLTADQQIANIPMAEETQPTDDAATADGATDGAASTDATASGA